MHSDGITAIIAENDRIAELIFLACRTIGLRIPEDLCLCGFDDTNVSRSLGINLHPSGFCRNRTRSRTDSAFRPQKSRRRDGKNHSSGNDRSARIVEKKICLPFPSMIEESFFIMLENRNRLMGFRPVRRLSIFVLYSHLTQTLFPKQGQMLSQSGYSQSASLLA